MQTSTCVGIVFVHACLLDSQMPVLTGRLCALAVLRPSGDVVSEETYNKCIKPDGEFKGKRVGPKDIIRLQGGGTGYAGRDGEKAQVKKHFSLGEFCLGCVGRCVQPRCTGGLIKSQPCSSRVERSFGLAAHPQCMYVSA